MSRSHNGYTSPAFGRGNDREGFEPLNKGDATIDIPMHDVKNTAYDGSQYVQNQSRSYTPPNGGTPVNEKQGLFKRRGKRKSVTIDSMNSHKRRGYDSEEDKITKMGHFYKRVLNYSVTVRYFIYILPVAAILAIPIIIGATSAQNAKIGGVQMIWVFVWLLISWVGLWTSKIVTHFLPTIFQAICGVVSASTRKYSMLLKNLEIPLSLVGWALVTLATFKPLMTRNPEARAEPPTVATPHWVSVVQQILAAGLVSSLIYLGECLFIQIISINYHRKQFHSRIKEGKHQLYLLSILYNASKTMFPNFCPEFAEEDAVINDLMDLSFGRHKHKGHSRSGSSTPAKILHDISNLGDKVSEALGHVAKDLTGKKNTFNTGNASSIVTRALEKNRSCEALARRLWLSFVIEGRESLYQEDLIEVLGPQMHTEAEEAFAMLDRDDNGDISLDEMVLTLTSFGRDRTSIATSMHDVDQAIKVLDRMLCVVIFIIVIFVFVAFLNASFVTTLATAGTALLSLSFVFSTTAQEILGSCIFLFVKHPFDIGDRVALNAQAGGTMDRMIVEHISLLFTVFRRIDSHRTVQIPNIVLNTVWIENVSRSSGMAEPINIYVAFDTSLEDIQLLRSEMKKFVTAPENARDFHKDVDIEVIDLGHMDALQLQITIQNKSNPANETVRAARRSKFMCALVLALRKVPIHGPGGGDPALGAEGNPSYSVAVSDSEAATKRDEAAKKKEAARMLTATKKESATPTAGPAASANNDSTPRPNITASTSPVELASGAELRGLTALNERNLASDPVRDAGTSRGDAAGLGLSSNNENVATPIYDSLNGRSTGFDPRLANLSSSSNAQILRRESTKTGRRRSNKSASNEAETSDAAAFTSSNTGYSAYPYPYAASAPPPLRIQPQQYQQYQQQPQRMQEITIPTISPPQPPPPILSHPAFSRSTENIVEPRSATQPISSTSAGGLTYLGPVRSISNPSIAISEEDREFDDGVDEGAMPRGMSSH